MPRGSPGSNGGAFEGSDGFTDSVVDMSASGGSLGTETRHGTETSSDSYGAVPTVRLSVPPVQSP